MPFHASSKADKMKVRGSEGRRGLVSRKIRRQLIRQLLEPGLNGDHARARQESATVAERQARASTFAVESPTVTGAGRSNRIVSVDAHRVFDSEILHRHCSAHAAGLTVLHIPSGIAMMAAMAAKAGAGLPGAGSGSGLAGVAGDLLGMKNPGALFIGVLRSETSQDRMIEQFNLKKVYGTGFGHRCAKNTGHENHDYSKTERVASFRSSVTDHNAQRAAAIANAYIDELNSLVASLSTSAAHRERVFLEERLKVVKVDLDNAANALGQFSSKNNTLDIQSEGKAMLEAAGTLAGQLIAAQSELEGLRQIYTDNNPRVSRV